jgi:hypothetical protein
MSKKEVAPAGDNIDMTSEDAARAIERASQKNPQLQMLRDKLIKAIEASDGGMESLVRVIRSKLAEG